ncbi:MAG TPA: histidine kinase, partial [Pilimelia sp.]|nr:histidine kinase [Pilimelia sp.]
MQRRDAYLLDGAVAGGALALTLVILGTRGMGAPDPTIPGLNALGAALGVASAAPLFLHRRAPGWVFGTTAAASLALLLAGFPLDVPPGVLVAGYWLAEATGRYRHPAARRAAWCAVAAFVPLAVGMLAARGERVWPILPEMSVWGLMVASVWIAGDRSRLRQERMAALEAQARQATRDAERDRRLAASQERTRIARELHDSAGHAINVILVQAGAARLLHERDPERSRRALATIEEVARGTITEIDQLVRALREDEGGTLPAPAGPAALAELIDRYRAAGLRVTSRVDGPATPLASGVAWAAYRILQEALTNAARHGTGSADVAVGSGPAGVEITVTNPTTAPPSAARGHGIVGMRERASLLGGALA